MELLLQKDLPHQQDAVDAVCKVFDGVYFELPKQFYENPRLDLHDVKIASNIQSIQQNLVPKR